VLILLAHPQKVRTATILFSRQLLQLAAAVVVLMELATVYKVALVAVLVKTAQEQLEQPTKALQDNL
jgi:hypothetical protein